MDRIVDENIILPIDEIRHLLRDRRLRFVAQECGLTNPTLYNLVNGDYKKTTFKTLNAVSKYLIHNSPNLEHTQNDQAY